MTNIRVRRAPALCFSFALASLAPAQNQEVSYAIPGTLHQTGPLTVQVGPTRVIAQEARTPLLTTFRDGTMVLTVGNPSVSTNIRSVDFGQWWEPQSQYLGYLNSVELANGTLLVIDYNLQLVNAATGTYRIDRWTSTNQGVTLGPPNTAGRATLPIAAYAPSNPHWINDVLEMPNGHLLAVVQSLSPGATSTNSPWDVALIESADGGANWSCKSAVASRSSIVDPAGLLTKQGWPLYWASEPTLVHTGGDHLVCVMRTVNDEMAQTSEKIGPPMSKYHDLSSTVPGSGIYTGILNLPANAFYRPGPPNAPLLIAHSTDGGATWAGDADDHGARGVPAARERRRRHAGAELRRPVGRAKVGARDLVQPRRRVHLDPRGGVRTLPDHGLHGARRCRSGALRLLLRQHSAAAVDQLPAMVDRRRRHHAAERDAQHGTDARDDAVMEAPTAISAMDPRAVRATRMTISVGPGGLPN